MRRIEREEAVEQVVRDLEMVMPEFLETEGVEGGGFRHGGPFAADLPPVFGTIDVVELTDELRTIHVVPWEWKGNDVKEGLVHLGPSFEGITIRGVTIVTRLDQDDDYDGYRLFRFVDWMDAFNQAGISVATRPIRDLRTNPDIDVDDLRKEYPDLDEAYQESENRPPIDPEDEWVRREVPDRVNKKAEEVAQSWFS